jgi:hypothetical protein
MELSSSTGSKRFECDGCGLLIQENWPHVTGKRDVHFCWDCAFRLQKITGKEYATQRGSSSGVGFIGRNGRIVIKHFGSKRSQNER